MHSGAQAHDRIAAAVELLERHRGLVLGVARRVSICTDDADDALQRSAEILITKAPPLPPERLLAWMVVVTRREAIAMRRSRERLLGLAPRGEGADDAAAAALERLPSERPGVEELFERRERVAEARVLLASLKADERAAIALKAGGYSYREICELRGWSYTKVNRCLAEGRAALRLRAAGGDAPPAGSSPAAPAGLRGP